MKNTSILFIGLLLTLSQFSFANVFSYTLEGFPKEDNNCYVLTKSIADRFETSTHTKVLHSECTKETETGFDFVIEYEADSKLEFTSTDYKFGGVYQKGRHAELKDCLANLPKQTEVFEKATGLKAMFNYCAHIGMSSGKPWEMIITAPGKSSMQPELGGFMVFTQPQKVTYEEIFEGLKATLQKYDSILADLVFASHFPMGEASIHYFSKDHLSFSLEHVTKVPKIENCVAQADEAKTWFKSSSNPPFAVYCGGPEFGEFELNIGVVERAAFTYQNSIEKFKTFEECQGHRDEVLSHYTGSSIKKTLGGLCSKNFEDNSYHIVIFREVKQ